MTRFQYHDEETLAPVSPSFTMESMARDWAKRGGLSLAEIDRFRLFSTEDGRCFESVGDVAPTCMQGLG